MKKIGIFAGTFDPIHNGHLAFARLALEQGLEKVYFLPEPRPRRKQGVKALEHRLAMVNLAVSHDKQLGSILLQQARFTPHETLAVLRKRFKGHQLVLLFGDDVIDHIAQWPHIRELVENVELLVAMRHHNHDRLVDTFRILQQTNGLMFQYSLVEPHEDTVSSSAIRQSFRQKTAATHLPAAVVTYIRSHKLYEPLP